jgi:AP-4 complex subunit mu-1
MDDELLGALFPVPLGSASTLMSHRASYEIPELYILSSRCEIIMRKVYMPHKVCRKVVDTFATHILRNPECPPILKLGPAHVLFIIRNGIILLTYSMANIAPAFALEFLHSLGNTLADFLGSLTEGALRRNQNMVYEILDEVADFGVVQSTNCGYLRTYVHEAPVTIKTKTRAAAWQTLSAVVGSHPASTTGTELRSIVSMDKDAGLKSEVFVDILERLSATFDAGGSTVSHVQCIGSIKVKSFLVGSPEVHLGLTHNLTLESDGIMAKKDFGIVCLHHYNFHKCVRTADWDNFRLLKFVPPEGEVCVMNYTCVENVVMPFKIFTFVEQLSPYIQDIVIKVRSEVPESSRATNVVVTCPCPPDAVNATFEFGIKKQRSVAGQAAEFLESSRTFKWGIQEFSGTTSSEMILFARVSRSAVITPGSLRQGTGPVRMDFEIQQWCPSNMSVQSVKVDENSKYYAPKKWVRNVCLSDTYISHHIQYFGVDDPVTTH